MKKYLLSLAILIAMALPLSAMPNDSDYFRHIRWGTLAENVKDLEKIQENGLLSIYTKPADEVVFEGADPEYTVYTFHKTYGFLMATCTREEGKNEYQQIRTILTEQFGPPDDQDADNEYWYGDKTTIILTFDPDENATYYFFLSTDLLKTLNAQGIYHPFLK